MHCRPCRQALLQVNTPKLLAALMGAYLLQAFQSFPSLAPQYLVHVENSSVHDDVQNHSLPVFI